MIPYCGQAVEIGSNAASDMMGKKFTNAALRRNDKVTTMGSKGKMGNMVNVTEDNTGDNR